jgi:hypothetical protein
MLERIIWFLELVTNVIQVFQIVWRLLGSWREFRNANPGTPQSSIEDEYDLELIDAMSSNGGERAP